jgi:hypothetical protein
MSFLDVKNDYFIETLEILRKPDFQTCLCKRSQWKTTFFAKYQKFRWTILFTSAINFHVNWRNLAHAHFYDFARAFERWRKSQPSRISPEKLILSENEEEKRKLVPTPLWIHNSLYILYLWRTHFHYKNVAYILYSALLHLPPLRFHCADGCRDRTQDRCNWCIGSQSSN